MDTVKLEKPRGAKDWMALYRLYRSAFPISERKPIAILLKMYREKRTDIWCIRHENTFAGLALTVNGDNLTLLDYFAIEEKYRGRGLGSKALNALRDRYAPGGLFIEIESTLEEAQNRPERLRRKAFYLRCGMEELGTTAKLFGVNMELMGIRCRLDYAGYKEFYRAFYGQWGADHIEPC